MDNDEQKKYDIEKLAESNNRERKINNDFDDDDYFGMDFFKTMEEIYSQISKNEQNNENCEKKLRKTMIFKLK